MTKSLEILFLSLGVGTFVYLLISLIGLSIALFNNNHLNNKYDSYEILENSIFIGFYIAIITSLGFFIYLNFFIC
jgi:hypothetical protein